MGYGSRYTYVQLWAKVNIYLHSLPFQVVVALEYLEIKIYFCPRLYMLYTCWTVPSVAAAFPRVPLTVCAPACTAHSQVIISRG